MIRDACKWEVDPERNGIEVRCCVLSRAAGKGLGRSGICVFKFVHLRSHTPRTLNEKLVANETEQS
jgi:hypothetical protein